MSRTPAEETAPTMIIPRGVRIETDDEGHLSIHSPGNLVVQSSGKYGVLESLGGSIRIDRGVEVEARTIRCAETCYVQGFLTAWKVNARSLHLEDHARAHVVLQETQRLEIGRDARLVGNFSSEKELLGLFSRFAQQVRSLPFLFDRRNGTAAELPGHVPETLEIEGTAESGEAAPLSEFPEPLLFARILLERESENRIHDPASQRALDELIKLLQVQDTETLGLTYRTLFSHISEPREDVCRGHEMVADYYTGMWPETTRSSSAR